MFRPSRTKAVEIGHRLLTAHDLLADGAKGFRKITADR
jgi:hypothetical protein